MGFWERFTRIVVSGQIFDEVNDWIRNSEGSVVNLLSAIAPWAAPVAPAYLSLMHMTHRLSFPQPVAISVAVVVEILGLTTISTAISFWSHNRRYQKAKDYKKAPVGLVIGAFVFYLVVIISVNVILDVFPESRVAVIVSNGLLTTLSIPAATVLAVRTQHTELVKAIKEENVKRQAKKEDQPAGRASVKSNKIEALLNQAWDVEHRVLTGKEIVEQLQVAKSTASEQRKKWLAAHPETAQQVPPTEQVASKEQVTA
jgi:hypothetical protein